MPRTPSKTRKFSGNQFQRAASIQNPRLFNRLQHLAAAARKGGYNARVVKNKHSASVYLRKRTYNAPIPETDALRREIFPISAMRASQSLNFVPKTASTGNYKTDSREMNDLADAFPEIVNSQIIEIEDKGREIKASMRSIAQNILNIRNMAEDQLNTYGESEWNSGKSNLTPELWDLIEKHPSISPTFDNLEEPTELMTAKILGEHAFINTSLTLRGDANIEQEYSYGPSSINPQLWNLYDENGVTLRTYDGNFVEAAEQRASESLMEKWRRQFVLGIRELGSTEHQVVAGLLNENPESQLQKMKESLDYNNWEIPNYTNSTMSKAQIRAAIEDAVIEVNALNPINELEVIKVKKEQDAEEKLPIMGRTVTMERLTFATEDIREVLSIMGWDRKETDGNRISTITELREGPAITVKREGESEVPDGSIWIEGHLRKKPTYNYEFVIPKKNANEHKLWTAPRTNMEGKKNKRAKKAMADYLYYRTKVLNEKPTTGEILEHINGKYPKQPITMNQAGNILARDSRFEGTGFLDVSSTPLRGRRENLQIRVRQKTWKLSQPSGV